ncbi:MAG TPA: peptidoglycan-associated lipoprotein Pal [Thermoanaerobaculia bacterium]|nr:peptidoglycan-associated lipoprotein Pal [Thermoanaerobaculia bacterium]
MKQKRHRWVGFFVTTLLVMPFLLVGCPKRPEIAETTPKAIGPQGAIAMPGPALPPPPTVSAVPPTVPPSEEKSPPKVTTAQTQETETAGEGRVEEAEVKTGAGVKEADVMSRASPAETEVKPETSTLVKEAEATPGSETQARGAEVGAVPGIASPSGAEPSPVGTSPSAPAEPVTAPPVAAAPVESPSGPAVAQAPKGLDVTVKDIFFDFDQAAIRDDSKTTLADNVLWLRTNPAAKVTIEGHSDERGSSEYNLALGERRARVTRDFLVAAGIEANRVNTISFGKERPFVLGHDESAWKWNRRAHFTLSIK